MNKRTDVLKWQRACVYISNKETHHILSVESGNPLIEWFCFYIQSSWKQLRYASRGCFLPKRSRMLNCVLHLKTSSVLQDAYQCLLAPQIFFAMAASTTGFACTLCHQHEWDPTYSGHERRAAAAAAAAGTGPVCERSDEAAKQQSSYRKRDNRKRRLAIEGEREILDDKERASLSLFLFDSLRNLFLSLSLSLFVRESSTLQLHVKRKRGLFVRPFDPGKEGSTFALVTSL